MDQKKESKDPSLAKDTDHVPACFVHKVSQIKEYGSGEKKSKYFNYEVQTESGRIGGVCFSPNKHSILQSAEKSKSPVKLSKIRISRKYGKEDIAMDRRSSVSVIQPVEGFNFEEDVATQDVNIHSLDKLSSEQFVPISGKVLQVLGTKTINIIYGSLKKQEVFVADKTGSVKVVLWENNCHAITVGKSYKMQNLRLKVSDSGEKYLNTAKTETFLYKEIANINDVVAITSLPGLRSTDVFGYVGGVQEFVRYKVCCSCHKRVFQKSSMSFGKCAGCGTLQKLDKCNEQVYARVLFVNSGNENKGEKVKLTVFKKELEEMLMASDDEEVCINELSEDELMEKLLSIKDVKIIYDTLNHKIVEVFKAQI